MSPLSPQTLDSLHQSHIDWQTTTSEDVNLVKEEQSQQLDVVLVLGEGQKLIQETDEEVSVKEVTVITERLPSGGPSPTSSLGKGGRLGQGISGQSQGLGQGISGQSQGQNQGISGQKLEPTQRLGQGFTPYLPSQKITGNLGQGFLGQLIYIFPYQKNFFQTPLRQNAIHPLSPLKEFH